MPVCRATPAAVAKAAPLLSCVVRATREQSRRIHSSHDRMAGTSRAWSSTGVVGRGTFPAALAGEESILLASADLMLSLESLTPDRECTGLSETAHSLTAARKAAVAVPASARRQLKQEGRKRRRKRIGPSAGAGWPFRAGDRQSLCRKGTSAKTRTAAGGPRLDAQMPDGDRPGPLIAW
jgi:hypothetical protein